jgi:hypothetical protein
MRFERRNDGGSVKGQKGLRGEDCQAASEEGVATALYKNRLGDGLSVRQHLMGKKQ